MRDTELSGLCGRVTHKFNKSDFIFRIPARKMVKTPLKQRTNAVPLSGHWRYDSMNNGQRRLAHFTKLDPRLIAGLTSRSGG